MDVGIHKASTRGEYAWQIRENRRGTFLVQHWLQVVLSLFYIIIYYLHHYSYIAFVNTEQNHLKMFCNLRLQKKSLSIFQILQFGCNQCPFLLSCHTVESFENYFCLRALNLGTVLWNKVCPGGGVDLYEREGEYNIQGIRASIHTVSDIPATNTRARVHCFLPRDISCDELSEQAFL